jgi:hypothetical protein
VRRRRKKRRVDGSSPFSKRILCAALAAFTSHRRLCSDVQSERSIELNGFWKDFEFTKLSLWRLPWEYTTLNTTTNTSPFQIAISGKASTTLVRFGQLCLRFRFFAPEDISSARPRSVSDFMEYMAYFWPSDCVWRPVSWPDLH